MKGHLDVGLIIDGSRSINNANKYNWGRLVYSVGDLILQLPEQGTQVGVVVFSHTGELRIKLDEYHDLDELKYAVHNLHYPNNHTNTSGGLYVARTQLFNEHNGDRANAPNVAVLITATNSTVDTARTIPYAQDLYKNGIRVICIGIGDGISEDDIRAISSPPHEKDVDYFTRKSFYFSETFIRSLVDSIEQRQMEMTTAMKAYSGENKAEYNWGYVDYFVEPQLQLDKYLKHMTYVNRYNFHLFSDTLMLIVVRGDIKIHH